MEYNKLALPVLKWVGGKRQILPAIRQYIPQDFDAYYEPFVGGGAVLFDTQPKRAIINDINPELMNLYTVIRDDVESLIADLHKHDNTPEYFYELRSLDRDDQTYASLTPVQRASRIHYLNKTCYNGLFRVNHSGQFNSPFGKYKKPNYTNETTLRAVSEYFNAANIVFRCGDYESALEGVSAGDFVYLDPPYDPVSESANFTGYSKSGFNRDEQARLRDVCNELNKRGIKFLLSNSSTAFIRELYKEYNIVTVQAKRAINSVGNSRGQIDEVLVMNYE